MFALVDCNNFFVSCERVFQPRLQNQPVLVLSSNDGCVVARSQEVKALGIKMGQPAFEIRELIAQHAIQVFSSNFSLYTDLSRRIMAILEQASPNVEIYSIDEAFLDYSGIDPQTLAKQGEFLKIRVQQWTGIPISIGFAPTKTLAKIANFVAKHNPKTRGVCVLDSHSSILEQIHVQDIWGIGQQYTKKLKSYGIYTAQDLKCAPLPWIKKHMGIVGERLVHELNGTACLTLETTPALKKSLTVSRSFGQSITQLADLQQAVASFLCKAAQKMRRQNLSAGALSVFIQTNRFQQKIGHCRGDSLTFPEPVISTSQLLQSARILLERLYHPDQRYVKAGVCLLDLHDTRYLQQDMFTPSNNGPQQKRLMQTIDAINKKFGANTLTYGTAIGPTPWISKSTHRSKRFTTDWQELPEV